MGTLKPFIAFVLLSFVLGNYSAAQSRPKLFVEGQTRDCFSFREIHPAGIDVFLVDAAKEQEIAALSDRLQLELGRGDSGLQSAWKTCAELVRKVRNRKAIPKTVSDRNGRFSFSEVPSVPKLIVLGLTEREDVPMYYARADLSASADNSVILDFSGAESCGH